jgi:hypothetical protein
MDYHLELNWNILTLIYPRACTQYSDFLERAQLLTQKLLKQGYVVLRLKSSCKNSTIWLTFTDDGLQVMAKAYIAFAR